MTCLGRTVAVLTLAMLLCACQGKPAKTVVEKTVIKEVPAQCEPCPPCVPEGVSGHEEEVQQGPDMAILYHLVKRYEPVVFSHSNHVEYEENCEVCHHHSSDVERFPPCRECHGLPSDHLRKPGLLGAYHRQCMNCHRELESGPLGCEECHAKREGGAVDQAALARKYVADTMKLGHLADEFGEVVFNHKLHVTLTDKCEHCHHHHTDLEITPPCRECHTKTAEENGSKRLSLRDAYHEQCLGCHRATSSKGKGKSPLKCTECHEKGDGG